MALPEFLTKSIGEWSCNESRLMMHDHADRLCESKLTITPAVMGKFVLLSYHWRLDGKDQEGALLLGAKKDAAIASWVDTFHTSSSIMPLRGEYDATKVSLQGFYAAPPGPDWKWRFDIAGENGQLRFTMANITPDGHEEPAVAALYQRV